MRPIGRIVVLAALMVALQSTATMVTFPLRDLTGSDQVRQIILTPLDGPVTWDGVTYYSSTMYLMPTYGGATNALGQPVTGATTNIVGGNWRVSYMGLPRASQIYIPFGFTNTISAADPAFIRSGIVQVFNITISTNGALLYDPVGKTMAQVIATNLFPYWHGKTTNSAWKFFNSDGYTLNTNCWTYPLDFSGLSAGALNVVGGDDVVLITPQHAITAAHAWAGTNGSPVVFTATNGTFFTNYVASFTQPIAMVDIELVTFSNTAPAGVNPFPLLPSDALSYLPTNLIGDQVIWLKNTAGQAGGPHMDLQLTDIGPAMLGAATNPDPVNNPFYDSSAIGGDSGGPVFTLISTSTGQLRPVFLYSVEHVWIAGPWVSHPSYLPTIKGLIGTNQLQFVDLTRYQSTVPNLPPNGTVNLRSSQLPEAGLLGVNDYLLVVRENGSPSTQKESLSNILASLEQLPNWPTNFQVVGVGGGSTNGGPDIRPLTNLFTAPNTFGDDFTISGSGKVNVFGSFIQVWSPLFTSTADIRGDVFVSSSGFLTGAGKSIWLASRSAGGHTNMLLGTFGSPGDPVFLYSGNLDNIGSGTNIPVLFAQNKIFADLSQGSNVNAAQLINTAPDSALSANITKKGNLFNGANQLVQLDLTSRLPAVDASLLNNMNASQLLLGTMPIGREPAFTGGDATTAAGSGAIILNTVGSGGTVGDLNHVPRVTFTTKGLVTGATPVQISGPVIFASPTGLTNNTGLSPDSPLPLPHALTVVGGGTLNILQDKGNYSGPYLDVVAANSGLTIQAYNYPFSQWGCNLLATNDASTIFIEPGVSNITVQGLQLGSNTNEDGLKAQAVINCTFRDLWLHDNKGNGLLSQDSTGTLIERCLASNNGLNHTNVNHIHGLYASGTNLVVRGNVAFDNTNGYGIQLFGNAVGSNNVNCAVYENLMYKNSRGVTIAQDAGCTNFYFNNTCVSNINTAEQFYGRSTSTIFATNNICENNGNGALTSSGGNLIEDYNLVEAAVSLPGTHDVVGADAGTVNGTKGLYWLSNGSAARNAAFNRPPAVDFYGYPQTSVADIGAFQYYPHNWRSYDTRTLYRSSYPDYWSIFAFVPDTLLIPTGASATNLHVYVLGAPFAANFKVSSATQEFFRVLGDGTWALTDKDNIQDLYFNGAYSIVVGTNILFTGTETNSTIKGPTPGLIGIDTAGARYPVTNLVNLTLNLAAGSLTASSSGSGIALDAGTGTNTTLKGNFAGTNALYVDSRGAIISNNIARVDITNGQVTATGTLTSGSTTAGFKGLVASGDETNAAGSRVSYMTDVSAVTNRAALLVDRSNILSGTLTFPSPTNSVTLYAGGGDWLLQSATPVNFTNAIGGVAGYTYSADIIVSNSTAAAFTNRFDPQWIPRGWLATNLNTTLGIRASTVPASAELFVHVEARGAIETNYWLSF